MLKCIHCGEYKEDVVVGADPLLWEVNGEEWVVPSCGDCLQIRCDDI